MEEPLGDDVLCMRVAQVRVGVCVQEADRSATPVRVGVDGAQTSPRVPGREIVWSVSDNGPGIPEEHRERIFYPFFTTREKGSGVGLATAQKIAASHGGSVELESRPGAGATFRVHVPLDAEDA